MKKIELEYIIIVGRYRIIPLCKEAMCRLPTPRVFRRISRGKRRIKASGKWHSKGRKRRTFGARQAWSRLSKWQKIW